MLAHDFVFPPDEPDDDDVENREDDEADRVSKRIPIYLIDDECSKHEKGSRICPELVAQERDDNEQFYYTVAEQVERAEELAADRKLVGEVQERIGNNVVRIPYPLILSDICYKKRDRRDRDEHEQYPADDLGNGKNPLQDDADLEKLSDSFFLRGSFHVPKVYRNYERCIRSIGSICAR